jgi:ribosomal protein L37E
MSDPLNDFQSKFAAWMKVVIMLNQADKQLQLSINRFNTQKGAPINESDDIYAKAIAQNSTACSNLLDNLLSLSSDLNLSWVSLRNHIFLSNKSLGSTSHPNVSAEIFVQAWKENLPKIRETISLLDPQIMIPETPPDDLMQSNQSILALNQLPELILDDAWIKTIQQRSQKMKNLARIASEATALTHDKCPNCGSQITEKQRFCKSCGMPIITKASSTKSQYPPASSQPPEIPPSHAAPVADNIRCPRCGASNKPKNRFCTTCGAPIGR